MTGLAIDTPAYTSPEQARGDTTLGTPSDLYSLGCLLHELVTGSIPFTGTGWQILNQHLNDAPAPLSALRPGTPASSSNWSWNSSTRTPTAGRPRPTPAHGTRAPPPPRTPRSPAPDAVAHQLAS